MKSFFSQFVHSGDLVFDIGANVGEYTQAFVALGARVVAAEPNPQLLPMLKAIRPSGRVVVEAVAVGSAEGSGDLYLCGSDGLSSLSREWISVAGNSERFAGLVWSQRITVRLVTLDQLIRKYGSPQFIKVDVEGFEKDVLAGLTRAPAYLSFEVNSEFAEAAVACATQPCFSDDSRFNLTLGLSMKFINDEWISREEVVRFLRSPEFTEKRTYGDIVVRRDSREPYPNS
jgi:FkbM family methyltransferase